MLTTLLTALALAAAPAPVHGSPAQDPPKRAEVDGTLERLGVIEGHLTTPDGDLLVEEWSVHASLVKLLPHHAGIGIQVCAIDPVTGSFRFDSLPPGDVSLHAIRRTGERCAEVTVTTTAAAVTQVVLVYDGPDPARRIMLRIVNSGPTSFATARLAETALRAVAADGAVHPFERVRDRAWEYWTRDLDPGEYRLELVDPNFERWERTGVRPGQSVHATLMGRARLRATVLGPDGAPVPRYRLTVQQTAPFRTNLVHELQSEGQPPPADGTYRGLLEGSFKVSVTADGYGEHRAVADGLTADTTFELEVRLAPPRRMRGRVVHADGAPVAEGAAQFTLGAVAGHDINPGVTHTAHVEDERGTRQVDVPYRNASVRLTADGAFDLGDVSTGPAVLRVLVGDWIRHDVHVDLTSLTSPLTVRLPALGSVTGRMTFAAQRPYGDVYLRPKRDLLEWLLSPAPTGDRAGAVDANGRYHLGPLLAGVQQLELIALGRDTGHGFSGLTPLARVRVDVAPREPTPYDIDLTFKRPTTRVTVALTLSGEPPSEALSVRLVPSERYDAEGREQLPTNGHVDNGHAELESVGAAVFTVEVSRPGLWTHTSALPFTLSADQVAAGTDVNLFVDVPVVRGSVRVLTADGAPCADAEVWLGRTTREFMGIVIRTSETGELELALPSGRYALQLGARDGRSASQPLSVEFEWSTTERTRELRLPAR